MNSIKHNDRNNQSRRTSSMRAGVTIESLEDRRLMNAAHNSNAPLAGFANEPPQATVEMPLHVVSATSQRAAKTARSPLAAPNASAEPATHFNTTHLNAIPDAEFPSAGLSEDVITGVYSPRIKLWGGQRIGEASAAPARPLAWAGNSVGALPPTARPARPAPAPKHALLVEPNPASRSALTALLRTRGWHVTAVADCIAAEAHLAEHPDVVIVDLDRAETHGEALLRHIRATGDHTRVAIITDTALDPRVPRLARLRPDAMLSKPINVAALLRSLASPEPNTPPAWN